MDDQAMRGMPTGPELEISQHEWLATVNDMPDRDERCALALQVFATDVRREFAPDDELQTVPDSPRFPAIPANGLMALALIAAHRLRSYEGALVPCAPMADRAGGGTWAEDALMFVVRLPDRDGRLRVHITVPSADPERWYLPWKFDFQDGRVVGVWSVDYNIRPNDEPDDEGEAQNPQGD